MQSELYKNEIMCYACTISQMKGDIEEDLCNYMKGAPISWRFARNAISQLKSNHLKRLFWRHATVNDHYGKYMPYHENTPDLFWQIFQQLMNSFEVFNLKDTTLALDLLYQAFYFEMQTEQINMYDNAKFKQTDVTEEQFSKLMKMPYTADGHNISRQIVWMAIKVGNELLLSSLLQYGIMFMPPTIGLEWTYIKEAIKYLFFTRNNCKILPESLTHGLNPWEKILILRMKRNRRMFTTLRVVELLACDLYQREIHRCSICPVNESCRIIKYVNSSRFRCLKKGYDTIPEPLVTKQELGNFFEEVCRGQNSWGEISELYVKDLLSKFESLYPDSAGPLAPRSLQHLSRCQVRENLRQSEKFPYGIRDLGLPTSIKKYILLED